MYLLKDSAPFRKVKVGKRYLTYNSGPIDVIEKRSGLDKYRVKFVRTGTVKTVRGSQILEGNIRDPYAISVCGVACTGDIKTKGKYKVYYSIWHGMIDRCYNRKNKRYEAYKDVTVAKEWLVFENFYHDVSKIDGYDDEKINAGLLVLDKDLKQRKQKHKVYSKDTCTWLPPEINGKMQDGQQRDFIATAPDGNVYRSSNITDFARTHGLDRKHISGVLHGRAKSTQGWKFSYEEMI